jgi:hypothetical protein
VLTETLPEASAETLAATPAEAVTATPAEALTESPAERPLDALFDALTKADGTPAVDPHMALKPDRAAATYLIDAPHPKLTLEEMRRPDTGDPMDEVARVLSDVAPERRAALLAAIKAAREALAAEAADGGPAEPPSLIYALH